MSLDQEEDELLASKQGGDLLLYDYFKHLTSLTVLALGGVLIIVQNIPAEQIDRIKILATFVLVAASGVGAFHGASEIVKARTSGLAPGKIVYRLRTFIPLLLGGGVGIFLSLFLNILQ